VDKKLVFAGNTVKSAHQLWNKRRSLRYPARIQQKERVMVSELTEVAIVGSGPFGLSLAAQLSEYGVPFRIFGPPMESWRKHMPQGMRLKSDGFASDLYGNETGYTLKRYCAEHKIPYDDLRIPVQLETFVAYGIAFQRKLVPTLENKLVVGLKKAGFASRRLSAHLNRIVRQRAPQGAAQPVTR